MLVLVRHILPCNSAGANATALQPSPSFIAYSTRAPPVTLLNSLARDLASRERMSDHDRIFRQHGLDIALRQLAPVERAPLAELALCSSLPTLRTRDLMAGAEVVLTTGIESNVCRQIIAEFVEEPQQTAEMIIVSVADDQRLDFLWIGSKQFRGY